MNLQECLELNQRWISAYDHPEGVEKVAQLNRKWIGDHIAEESFMTKVCPPVTVSPEECDRTVNSKTPVMIEEIREGSWAMPIDFTGSTRNEVLPGSRYLVAFQKIQTAEHFYNVEELWTSKRPVLEHLKEDLAEALADALDRSFIVHTEVAVWFLFQDANAATQLNNTTLAAGTTEVSVFKSEGAKLVEDALGNPADTYAVQALRKEDLTILLRAFNGVAGEQLKASTMLITDYDYYGVSDWDLNEVGDAQAAQSVKTITGFNELKDIKVIRTKKQRFCRPGNVYAWAPWEYVGNHYKIGGTDSYQNKRGTRVEMFSWMIHGFGYGNVGGIRKLELFSGNANPDAAYDSALSVNVQPLAEDHVIKNHRADEGNWFPSVTMY